MPNIPLPRAAADDQTRTPPYDRFDDHAELQLPDGTTSTLGELLAEHDDDED